MAVTGAVCYHITKMSNDYDKYVTYLVTDVPLNRVRQVLTVPSSVYTA